MLKNRKKKGFTLIELIVVIAILGILAAVLIPRFTGFQDKARATQALTDAKQIATAIDSYQVDKNTWPAQADSTTITDLAGVNMTDKTLTINANGAFTIKEKIGDKYYTAGRDAGDSPVKLYDTDTK